MSDPEFPAADVGDFPLRAEKRLMPSTKPTRSVVRAGDQPGLPELQLIDPSSSAPASLARAFRTGTDRLASAASSTWRSVDVSDQARGHRRAEQRRTGPFRSNIDHHRVPESGHDTTDDQQETS